MAYTAIAAGIDTSLSSKLNENFALSRNLTTRINTATVLTTTSSTSQDFLTVTSPAAKKAGQILLVEAQFFGGMASGDEIEVRIYDNTGAAALNTLDTATTGDDTLCVMFLYGTTSLANVADTKSIKLQYRRSSGSTAAVNARTGYLKCSFIES